MNSICWSSDRLGTPSPVGGCRGGGALSMELTHLLEDSWLKSPEEGVFARALDADSVPRKLSSCSLLAPSAVLLSQSQVAISAEAEVLASEGGR